MGWLLYFLTIVLKNYQDIYSRYKRPLFYSAWLFPVYKIDISSGYIRKNNKNAVDLIICFLIIYLFGLGCAAYIRPRHNGIYISSLS